MLVSTHRTNPEGTGFSTGDSLEPNGSGERAAPPARSAISRNFNVNYKLPGDIIALKVLLLFQLL